MCENLHTRLPGLPRDVALNERIPRRFAPSPSDVFALVKHQLCDQALAQPALLVWPGAMVAESETFWRAACAHSGNRFVLDPERAQNLKDLATALENYPQYARAVRFYRLFADNLMPRVPPRQLEFIRVGGVRTGVVVAALPPREQRPNPYELRVRFRRAGGRGRGWNPVVCVKRKRQRWWRFEMEIWKKEVRCFTKRMTEEYLKLGPDSCFSQNSGGKASTMSFRQETGCKHLGPESWSCFCAMAIDCLCSASGKIHWFSLAGFPYEVLESAHYVPGNDRGDCSRYKQKPLWGEIMKITDSVCCLYGGRVHNDFMRKVDKDSSRKAKASEKMLPHFSTLPWICSVKYIVDDYKVSSSELFNLFFLAGLLPENAPAEPWRAPRANGHSLPLVLVAPQDSQHDGSQQHPTLGHPVW